MPDYFSWLWFAIVGVIYSAVVFTGEMSKDGPLIFSKRNAKSLSEIIRIHLAFLFFILALLWFTIRIMPFMPNWMSEKIRRGLTYYDVFFVLAMIGLSLIERRWLFVESETFVLYHENADENDSTS